MQRGVPPKLLKTLTSGPAPGWQVEGFQESDPARQAQDLAAGIAGPLGAAQAGQAAGPGQAAPASTHPSP